jgi:uncharacterized protein GlcG (DUF336 family)
MPTLHFPPVAILAFCGSLFMVSLARSANCPVTHDQLTQALKASVKPSGGPSNGGLDNNMWGVVIARDGTVCAVAFTGASGGDQWPASRAIAAEKANTANGVSVDAMAISSANLYAGAQPGGPLWGVEVTNPVNPQVIYAGQVAQFGTESDPMIGQIVGGVVVFGGGLGLYDGSAIVGALGVSGDSSCADHNVAWRTRQALGLDKVPAGVNPQHKDAIIYDLDPNNKSASGYGHPKCAGAEADVANAIGAGVGGNSLK